MTEITMIAPIQLDDLLLIKSSFQIADSPASKMTQKIGLDFTVRQLESDGDEGLVSLSLTVDTSLVDRENEDEEKLSASVEVVVSAHASLSPDITKEQTEEYLLSNALSMAYGHAKTCIMTVTGLSPAGPVMIPAILPLDIARDYLRGRVDVVKE